MARLAAEILASAGRSEYRRAVSGGGSAARADCVQGAWSMNVFESIRQELVRHAAAVDTRDTGLQCATRHDLTAGELTAEQIVGVLSGLDAVGSEKLHWQTSIVGFMNVLGLDPSSSNLKRLAQELEYQGDSTDATALNGWLHRAVMQKLIDRRG